MRGLHTWAAVEVLDGVQNGDLIAARDQRQGDPVVKRGQAEPDAFRHDPLGFPAHPKQSVFNFGVAAPAEFVKGLLGLRDRLHACGIS